MTPRSHERASNAKGAGLSGSHDPRETLPLTHVIIVEQIPEGGLDIVIEADANERAALAAADSLAAIGELKANFHVMPGPHKGIHVSGRVTGLVTQTCVVSLEDFETPVSEDVDVDFLPAEALDKAQRETMLARERGRAADEEEDVPDPIIDGKIDLGALASEFLALALDPYPRKPGIQFKEVLIGDNDDRPSPFAVLKTLKE